MTNNQSVDVKSHSSCVTATSTITFTRPHVRAASDLGIDGGRLTAGVEGQGLGSFWGWQRVQEAVAGLLGGALTPQGAAQRRQADCGRPTICCHPARATGRCAFASLEYPHYKKAWDSCDTYQVNNNPNS